MTHPSKQKGNRAEREIVDLHKEINVPCVRVPLSGAVGGDFSGDLRIGSGPPGDIRWCAEVKARANGQGFVTLEKWLGKNEMLFLRRDRAKPLVVLPWEIYAKLIQRFTS